MRRLLSACVCAAALIAVKAAPARADLAGPWPWSRTPQRSQRYISDPVPQFASDPVPRPAGNAVEPQLQQGAIDPTSGLPYPPPLKPDPPKRSGPFRSCGSGMGLGLAGIGAAWAMMWLGNRFARSLSRSPSARG